MSPKPLTFQREISKIKSSSINFKEEEVGPPDLQT
jgi:hypothetical protein